ncbi:MAG TPA: hypothetical protein VKT49_09550 [Bryobacteraceae bacterium]|nr:hypothetical protein [Bryobacteraceae bacterium]
MTRAILICFASSIGAAWANPISVGVGSFSNPSATILFGGIANNALITNQFAAQDVIFSGGLYGDTNAGDVGMFSSVGGGSVVAGNFQNQVCTTATCGPITATFASEVSGVGFYIITQPGTTTVAVYSGHSSTATGTFTFATNDSSPPAFFGVKDVAGIDRIVITDNAPPGGFAIDKFMIVPEASSLFGLAGLLLCGLLVRIGARRRLQSRL